jgi:hypothetical protein
VPNRNLAGASIWGQHCKNAFVEKKETFSHVDLRPTADPKSKIKSLGVEVPNKRLANEMEPATTLVLAVIVISSLLGTASA